MLHVYINRTVQDCSISVALAMEIRQVLPLIYIFYIFLYEHVYMFTDNIDLYQVYSIFLCFNIPLTCFSFPQLIVVYHFIINSLNDNLFFQPV